MIPNMDFGACDMLYIVDTLGTEESVHISEVEVS